VLSVLATDLLAGDAILVYVYLAVASLVGLNSFCTVGKGGAGLGKRVSLS